MASILKTDEIQSQNGGAVVKMQTLKHPSASGNNLELASDGSATINEISSSSVFPAGNIKKIYCKTLTSTSSTLQASSTSVSLDADSEGITIPSVSNGDFLWCMFTGGRARAGNNNPGTSCYAWIVCNGNARAKYFHYSLAGYDMGVSIIHLETITANATNYVIKRGVSAENSSNTVSWYCDSTYAPVEMAVFHIGSGAISDVSDT